MEHLKYVRSQANLRLAAGIVVSNLIIVGLWLLGGSLPKIILLAISLAVVALALLISTKFVTSIVLEPLQTLVQAIMYVSRQQGTTAPMTEKLTFERQFFAGIVAQVYELARRGYQAQSIREDELAGVGSDGPSKTVLDTLPVPIVVIDSKQLVNYANPAAVQYLGLDAETIKGSNVNDTVNLSFTSDDTYETWLKDNQESKLTNSKYWQRVRVNDISGKMLHQTDLIAYYNKGLGSEILSTLVFFDRDEQYAQDDQGLTFVALAVHELRTPLTTMRGYIEVIEEELAGKTTPELTEFINKLSVSAQQLSVFISNVLNVARVEENQLVLHLEENEWQPILHKMGDEIEPRARVHGKHFEYNIHAGLPTVAADRVSIYEVLNNLLDNAIKYSGSSERIIISARLNQEGMIETTVEDFGLGIPLGVMPNIFTKFYRNHRSRNNIGGSGLGLFICKSIIEAHGGHIWVKSKEGEGSIFGFTLQPYSSVAKEDQNGDNGEITRDAHGWIKNHSLYRR